MVMSLGITTATPAIAETFDEAILDEVTPRDISKPTGETTLPYTANLYDLWAQKGTYTLYSFKTSTGELNLEWDLEAVRPYEGARSMRVEVYKKNTFTWSRVDYESFFFYDSGNGELSFTGLDTDKLYCIRFNNTSSENTDTDYHNSISGTIIISE